MPAAMRTKVWPSPSSSTGTMATRMFCELRMVRKLTEPPVDSGTATTKNNTITARNSHAHMRLKNSTSRCREEPPPGPWAPAGAAIEPRIVTSCFPSPSDPEVAAGRDGSLVMPSEPPLAVAAIGYLPTL